MNKKSVRTLSGTQAEMVKKAEIKGDRVTVPAVIEVDEISGEATHCWTFRGDALISFTPEPAGGFTVHVTLADKALNKVLAFDNGEHISVKCLANGDPILGAFQLPRIIKIRDGNPYCKTEVFYPDRHSPEGGAWFSGRVNNCHIEKTAQPGGTAAPEKPKQVKRAVTVTQAANDFRVTRPTINKWERGQGNPPKNFTLADSNIYALCLKEYLTTKRFNDHVSEGLKNGRAFSGKQQYRSRTISRGDIGHGREADYTNRDPMED